MSLQTINPKNGEPLNTYSCLNKSEVATVLQDMHEQYHEWRNLDFKERACHLKNVARVLLENKHDYAALMANEMGKPINAGVAEIEKCAWVCDYYADVAKTYLKPKSIATDAVQTQVQYQPMGLVFAIMPWNFPFWQVFRCVAPTMMAGNLVVLKHAEITTGCSLAIEDVFIKAGLPKNSFRSLLIAEADAQFVIEHQAVAAVTLTGSTRAGRDVAAKAGRALKKVVLELGGSDPYLVFDDADLDLAAQVCVDSRFNNCGQTCIAAKRLIVHESVHDAFVQKIKDLIQDKAFGDPLLRETTMGPMARHDLREQLHSQVQQTIAAGATCHFGGEIPEGPGFFYPVTLLTGVQPGMSVFDQEVFGPVASVISAKDEDEMVRLANQTPYGLGAALFTSNEARKQNLAISAIQSGTVAINGLVKSDPRVPFGGIKNSGFGRELGAEGILEFVNIKVIAEHGVVSKS